MGTLRLVIVLFASTLGWAGAAAYPAWTLSRRRFFVAAAALASACGLWTIAGVVRSTVRDVPRWDFLCFYIYGRVAVVARNVYDPAAFHRLGDGLTSDPEWIREILGVGFPYPPDSIVLPYVLGFFSTPRAAFVPWYALVLAGLIACIVLARQYVAGPWPVATLVTFAFVSFWLPTIATLHYAQTIFLVTACAFAYARERSDWRAGLWLGLAVVVKPLALVLVLIPLVRREWRTIGTFAATLLAAFGAAIGLIGFAAVLSYFTNSPLARYPASAYVESVDISTFAALLRARHHGAIASVSATDQIVFLLPALGVAIVTGLLIARSRERTRDGYALALTVCCALVIFPQTIDFYAFFLLVPFAILWKRTDHKLVVAGVIALDAVLTSVCGGSLGAAVLVLNWLGFASVLARENASARQP